MRKHCRHQAIALLVIVYQASFIWLQQACYLEKDITSSAIQDMLGHADWDTADTAMCSS